MSVIESVQAVLNSEVQPEQVAGLEPLRAPLLALRCEKQAELLKMREKYRHPKDKELTDFDRKTMLESFTAEVQTEYELLRGLEVLVSERIALIREFYGSTDKG